MLLVLSVFDMRSDLMTPQSFGARQSFGHAIRLTLYNAKAQVHCSHAFHGLRGPQTPVLLQVHLVSVPS